MLKEYLFFKVRSKKTLLVFITIVHALALLTGWLSELSSQNSVLLCLGLSFAVLMISCYAIVPLNLSYIHNKKSVDTYLSLPYSRRELLLLDLGFSIICAVLPWLIASVPVCLVGIFVTNANIFIYLAYLVSAFISAIALIVFNSFIYTLANSVFDGIIAICAYLVAPLMLLLAAMTFQEQYVAGFNPIDEYSLGWLSLPFVVGVYFFEWMEQIATLGLGDTLEYYPMILCFLYLIVNILVFGFFLVKRFENRHVEKAESASSHPLAYPAIIYYYTFILLFLVSSVLDIGRLLERFEFFPIILTYSLIFIFFVVAHFIYRRRIYINTRMIVFYFGTIILTSVFMLGADYTKGYGLSNSYSTEFETAIYSYAFGSGSREQMEMMGFDVDAIYDYYNQDYNQGSFEVVNEDCFQTKECFYFDVDVDMVVEKGKRAEYEQAIQYFEDLRKVAIDDFYNRDHDYTAYSNLRIGYDYLDYYKQTHINNQNNPPQIYMCNEDYYYYFNQYKVLTVEELELLSPYATIRISFGNRVFDFDELKEFKVQ